MPSPVAHDNKRILALPDDLFLRTLTTTDLETSVIDTQSSHAPLLSCWANTYPLTQHADGSWWHGSRLIVMADDSLRRGVTSLYHDLPTAGHPGVLKTCHLLAKDYWWPHMKDFVSAFVRGCATCQATKPLTTQPRIPHYPISVAHTALPFETITMDLIVKLPSSSGFDSILTITDHDCSKATLFIPCHESVTAAGIADLYVQHVFPHYGTPCKIITDRDTRFASHFPRELCRVLDIKQNISTTYHPQTNGQSERTNQWLEQYLCIFINHRQTTWHKWLPLAQYIHNTWLNSTTTKAPFDLIMGHTPRAHQPQRPSPMPSIQSQINDITALRTHAQNAISHAQHLVTKQRDKNTKFRPFTKGQKVWLEGTNLKLTHPTTKLAPRHYGPFVISRVLSPVVYQLTVPPQWKQKLLRFISFSA